MKERQIDLLGKVCPYPVVEVVRAVDKMAEGDRLIFLIDDPLAIKSIPEELEEYINHEVFIEKRHRHWAITVTKS